MIAVCLGPGGIPKHPVEAAQVSELGLEGDAHRYSGHGGPNRAVCLFFAEDYETLRQDGVPCETPGAFGENLLIAGLDPSQLRPQDKLLVGPEVVLQIHDVRAPCGTLKSLDSRFPELMVGRSGFVCSVERGGRLAAGMRVLASLAEPE